MTYQHLLVAISNADESEPLLQKAQALAKIFGAQLSLSHAVPFVVTESVGEMPITPALEITEDLQRASQAMLKTLCEKHGIDPGRAYVSIGGASDEILRIAAEVGADLIIVGHSPRHGLISFLFGHTESSVVSHSKCDVLAVMLPAA